MNPQSAALFAAIPAIICLAIRPAWAGPTGVLNGRVTDPQGELIPKARVEATHVATNTTFLGETNEEGLYRIPSLLPGKYKVVVQMPGFRSIEKPEVVLHVEDVITLNFQMEVGALHESITVEEGAPLLEDGGPQLGRVVDSRAVSELPLATRNFTQILGLSPGTAVDLPDSTGVGRNSQNVAVNGARLTQNNFQINGVDANYIGTHAAALLAVPAPESIQEFRVQTSLYDASFGRSGGNIQIVTKSGDNNLHGAAYEYFRNHALNANNPFLKAAGVERPVLQRNVFGGLLGGPIRKDKAFFFVSYQGTHERNAASPNSLSSSVLVADGLMDDRSEQTLLRIFRPVLPNGLPATSIHPTALALLNIQLPKGRYLIPTPQENGRYSGSAPSRFREEQFSTNVDYRLSETNWLAVKFFFSDNPTSLALSDNGGNIPGFGDEREQKNRITSLQNVSIFSPKATNEVRLGYTFIGNNSLVAEAPVRDVDVGIRRPNAAAFPGLPRIRINPGARGIVFGTPVLADNKNAGSTWTATDIFSISVGRHGLRTGADVIYNQNNLTSYQNSRGQIDFDTFVDFLTGITSRSDLGTGLGERSLRSSDYSFFLQDDWKASSKLTINLGFRYDLSLPPYDTRGRLSTFDPVLYKPRLEVDGSRTPIGPPIGGFVQAGNVIALYNLPDLPKVGKRVINSVDPNNFAPRVGFAYVPHGSRHLVWRGGYGIFYSRVSNLYLSTNIQVAPFYLSARSGSQRFAEPFPVVPSLDQFPTFVPGIALANHVFDRNMRTPYLHQYNTSVQYEFGANLLFEIAYVGTRGLNLLRVVGFNQARLASQERPIFEEVTGQVITTNTPQNAPLRAPFQGVTINAPTGQNQTTAQSSYNSLQASLTQRLSHGLQFLASYTYAKSIDNSSSGSAAGVPNEVAFIVGNQLDNRANRGVSAFDRTHRFVLTYLWDLPQPVSAASSTAWRWLLADWQVAGIIVAMSGRPIDLLDLQAGSLYGLDRGNNPLARPNYASGATSRTATHNVPAGYFFNPFAFARPIVQAGQPIPSSNGSAIAGATGTDIGHVGRNVLRGPRQTNVDFSIIKRFQVGEAKNIEFRAEFFNLFNQVNLSNPISNLNAIPVGGFDATTGQVINPGSFGQITSTSSNQRLIQFALKFNF